jgi:XRE family transcriptional regulator, regulator of sulfur utilization
VRTASPTRGRPKGANTFDPVLARAIGEVARELRLERAGLSQEAMAAAALIERSHLGKLERGEHMPSLTMLWRLAAVIGITASDLIAEVERKLPESHDPFASAGLR